MIKHILLAGLLALAASSASAATYSYTTSAAQEDAITDARVRYNNSIPATVCSGAPVVCVANPDLKAANGGFILMVLNNAVQNWNEVAVKPSLSVPEKASTVTMLNAAVARADANSPAAQALLDKINAAK